MGKPVTTDAALGYSVGDVARMVGISPSTLRAWEHSGLVAASRTEGGWRRYDEAAVRRTREVRRLREVDGLALHAIRRRLRETAPRARSLPRPPGPTTVQDLGLGRKLRELRVQRGVSLRALAAAAGVSPSLLSGVERGVVHPSVASVQKLSAALGTRVAALLASPASACQVLGGDAPPLALVPGVRIENLTGTATLLEPQRFTIDPGSGSGGEYSHAGEEFLYVLEGRLAITLDGQEHFDVGPGMSLCFESTRGHRWWNPGDVATRLIWINTPRSF